MACLIAYHYLNRREYRNDTRYRRQLSSSSRPASPSATASRY